MKKILSVLLGFAGLTVMAQSLPSTIVFKDITGGEFTMGSNTLDGNPTQKEAAPEHQVTLSPYSISEAEISNEQFKQFLNQAYKAGLIEIAEGQGGPDLGKRFIVGSSTSNYEGKTLYSLDGIRVLKDHDDKDVDDDPFTGDVEPENPLNVAYIGFNVAADSFNILDPHNPSDFNWLEICNYYDYGTTKFSIDSSTVHNDFADWSGAGQMFSDELEGWTEQNPELATKLPTKAEISNWPATFIKWWGAKAFVDFYGLSLPTEAQWEFAAKGGQNFQYAVHDGSDISDANWNSEKLKYAYHHPRNVISGMANPFGLYNMAGNVWEWIADNYVAPYSTDAVTDPLIEVANSSERCWRGGSWNYHQATLQSALRDSDEEARGNDHFGFRVARASGTSYINDEGKGDFRIYPNPVLGSTLTIQTTAVNVTYSIMNNAGKIVGSGTLLNNKVNVSELTRGAYVIKLYVDGQQYPLKFIK